MEWIKELGEFLWAVVNNWAGYATGGVIVAILWLWSTYFQKSVSKRWGIGLAILFLAIAIFNAWREQHQQVLTMQGTLDSLTVPSLTAKLNIAYGPIGKDNQDTMMTIAGLIKNGGAPTILDQWRAEIRFDDGKVVEGKIPLAPKPVDVITSSDREGKNTLQLSGADWWPRKTRSSPIVSGGAADGWLFVFFPVLAQDVHDKKATVVLSCRDRNEKDWPFQYKLEGQNSVLLNVGDIPGVKVEPLNPPK